MKQKKIFNSISKFYGEDTQNEKCGKIIHTIEEDINDISFTVTDKIFSIVNDFVTALFSFFVLLYTSPLILGVVFALQILLFFINKTLSERIKKLNNEYFHIRDDQGSSLQEFMLNLDYLIGSNLVNFYSEKFINREKKITNIAYNINKTMSINYCYQNILNAITKCIIWGGGGILVIMKKVTMGKLYAVDVYSGKLAAPIYRIIESNLEIKKLMVEIDRVYSLVNKKFIIEKNGIINLNGKVINFHDIDFTYDQKKFIFKNLNLTIYPNQVNVFVGKSGQGKTTIIKLLTHMWKVNSGEILVDNVSLYEYSKMELRNQIGIVSQDIPIFNTTILENLVLSNTIPIDDVIHACILTGIYNEIMNMKEQFNTVISEYGRNLSGGQKQRIAITRAILKKAEVIILDEPTASLDYENREKINKLIFGLTDITVILITHDDELIKHASNVYLIKDGKAELLQ